MVNLWELDEFQLPQFLGYVRGVPEPAGFSGQTFLPNKSVDELAFEYIKGTNNRPVMAHVMAFDSEAPLAGLRGKGERVTGELPPIKRKAKFSEKDIIRFLQPRQNSSDTQVAVDSVYDRTDELIYGVNARAEWLRMQALSEDVVDYNEGGVIFRFDFGIDPEFQINLPTQSNGAGTSIADNVGPAWSDFENSTPLTDLLFMQELQKNKTGYAPARLVLSPTAVGYLLRSVSLRNLIRGEYAPAALLTKEELTTLFRIYDLPELVEYDVRLDRENADGSVEQIRAMRVDRGFFLPSVEVGNTLWGPTAESRALIGTTLQDQAPGIIAVTYATEEPPAEYVKVAATAFPTLPQAHLIGQIELF